MDCIWNKTVINNKDKCNKSKQLVAESEAYSLYFPNIYSSNLCNLHRITFLIHPSIHTTHNAQMDFVWLEYQRLYNQYHMFFRFEWSKQFSLIEYHFVSNHIEYRVLNKWHVFDYSYICVCPFSIFIFSCAIITRDTQSTPFFPEYIRWYLCDLRRRMLIRKRSSLHWNIGDCIIDFLISITADTLHSSKQSSLSVSSLLFSNESKHKSMIKSCDLFKSLTFFWFTHPKTQTHFDTHSILFWYNTHFFFYNSLYYTIITSGVWFV